MTVLAKIRSFVIIFIYIFFRYTYLATLPEHLGFEGCDGATPKSIITGVRWLRFTSRVRHGINVNPHWPDSNQRR